MSRAAIIAVAIIVNVGKGEGHAAIVHYLVAFAQAMLADATSLDTPADKAGNVMRRWLKRGLLAVLLLLAVSYTHLDVYKRQA